MVNVPAPNPLIVNDMRMMLKFVFDFGANKVAAMQQLLPKKKQEDASKTEEQGK